MIRMIQSRAASHAKAYFSDALAKSDYYVSDQELPGFWQGRLAARLGLDGATAKEDFFALADNLHPRTGAHLTPRHRADRTTGYDINFHCPKSVSVLQAFAEDDHLLQAFQNSVTETMRLIEADAKTRVRKDGADGNRKTNELVWAHFTHLTARPSEGFLPDPHLHSHCFVFNATWDEVEKEIKAVQFRDIKRDMPFYQAHFHKVFADRLIDLGYQVRKTAKSFEIVGVPEKVTRLFSKRTDEIGRIAKEKGITDAKELDELGAKSRAKKQKGRSMMELKTEWRKQIDALGLDEKETAGAVRFAPQKETPQLTAQQCVDFALQHCFERASTMQDRRLLEAAYRHALGVPSVKAVEIQKNFEKDERIIRIEEGSRFLCTTREVLREEQRMVQLAKQGQGKLAPLYDKAPDLQLTGQQGAAITHILTTPHRVSIIRGAAGTGKTTLMTEAVAKIESASKNVTVLAPSSDAARDVLRREGFAEAETVARFLLDQKMQEKVKGQVIWVDEAGLLGTKDMLNLLEVATKNNARLILGGDTRQHASVVRGDALRILNTVGGIRTAEVNKIYRQQNAEYKSAVEDLAKGNIKSAFEKFDKMKAIKEIDPLNPHEELTRDFLSTIKRGKSALIICPTHAQGEALTAEIRAKMREEKLLGKKEITASRLKNLNLTEAEKADVRKYEAGQFIQFSQHAAGIKRGSLWQVESVEGNKITLINPNNERAFLPLDKSNRFDVFTLTEIQLSKGDTIRITREGFDENQKRLTNGQILQVTAVSKNGTIKLQSPNGQATYQLNKTFGHFMHAHVITSYASQGKTVDEIFIFQPAATFPATDAKQFYVSLSRGKHAARLYTDDKEELLYYATQPGNRQSALEAIGEHKDLIAQQQRITQDPTKQITKPQTKENYEREI